MPTEHEQEGEEGATQVQRQSEARREFLAEFPTLTSEQIAQLSQSSARNTAALASRWKVARKIFAIPVGGTDRFPAFQFGDEGRPLAVIGEVLRILYSWTPWSVALWFASHTDWLDGDRPVDHLRSSPGRVVEAATGTVQPLEL